MSVTQGVAAAIASGGLKLEGLLHLPEGQPPFPGVVICHPHPQYGGDMYNNVVGAILRAGLNAGIAALRFNFRGVGESEGSYDGGRGEIDDVGAAVDYLRARPEVDEGRVAVAGYSFGAVVALRFAHAHPELRAVVAVSQPTIAGPHVEIHIDPPLLIVAGNRDQYCDTNLLQEYREQLGREVRLEVVPGVDHFWWGSDDRLTEKVVSFFRDRLAG